MRTKLLLVLALPGAFLAGTAGAAPHRAALGPLLPAETCDIYALHATPCIAAHSLTRRMWGQYRGALFQLTRASDGKTSDIGSLPSGVANEAAVSAFCSGTTCKVSLIYDQMNSPASGNNLPQATGANQAPIASFTPPRGATLPYAAIASGEYYRNRTSTVRMPIGNSATTEYMVIRNGASSACCGTYGNMETTVADGSNGNMFALALGENSVGGIGANGNGTEPWAGVDMENGVFYYGDPPYALYPAIFAKYNPTGTVIELRQGDATKPALITNYSGVMPASYTAAWQGGLSLGEGGDASAAPVNFIEGAILASTSADATDSLVQANIAAFYGAPASTPAATAQLNAWVAAVTAAGGTVGTSEKGYVSTLLTTLNSEGLAASACDRIWLHASENTQEATIDILNDGVATPAGTITFTADQGYQGNGSTGYLNTGFAPYFNAGANFSLNSGSDGSYVRTSRTASAAYAELGTSTSGSNSADIFPLNTGTTAYFELNVNASSMSAPANAQGFWLVSRTGASAGEVYHNGTAYGAISTTATGLGTGSFVVAGKMSGVTFATTAGYTPDQSGNVSSFSADQIAATVICGGLNATQAANLSAAIDAYMTSVGANVY